MGLLGVCRGIGWVSGFGFRISDRSPGCGWIVNSSHFIISQPLSIYVCFLQKYWGLTLWNVRAKKRERDRKLSLRLWRPFRRSHGREGRDGSGAGPCTEGSGGRPPPHVRRFLAEIWGNISQWQLIDTYNIHVFKSGGMDLITFSSSSSPHWSQLASHHHRWSAGRVAAV